MRIRVLHAAPTADVCGAPRRASRLHRQRGLHRDGDSEQVQKHQARHRRDVRIVLALSLGFLCTDAQAWTITEKACERTGPSRRSSSTAPALDLRGGSRRAWSRQKPAPACD